MLEWKAVEGWINHCRPLNLTTMLHFLKNWSHGVWSSVTLKLQIKPLSPFTLCFSFFSTAILYTSCILVGIFINSSVPIFFELFIETVYPVPEGITCGVVTFLGNLATGLLLFFLTFYCTGKTYPFLLCNFLKDSLFLNLFTKFSFLTLLQRVFIV